MLSKLMLPVLGRLSNDNRRSDANTRGKLKHSNRNRYENDTPPHTTSARVSSKPEAVIP
jgi:hypothetical protein